MITYTIIPLAGQTYSCSVRYNQQEQTERWSGSVAGIAMSFPVMVTTELFQLAADKLALDFGNPINDKCSAQMVDLMLENSRY
jgi:hypothetical protein